MKKIKVRVQNFEIIKDATITIKGITGIIGESNNGKTSLFRAIRAAFNNTQGNSYIRQGEKSCTVGVLFEEDNGKIIWNKASSATYSFNNIKMEKTGRKLPEMIESYLNMSPVILDADKIEINFLPQLEPPLIRLLTESKTYKLLVKSLDGDKISTAIELCEKDISRNNELIKNKRMEHSIKLDAYNEIKDKLVRYQPLEKLKPFYESVRHLPQTLEKLNYFRVLLLDNSRELIELNNEYKKFKVKIGYFDNFDVFLETHKGYLTFKDTHKTLVSDFNSLNTLKQEVFFYESKKSVMVKLDNVYKNQLDLQSVILISRSLKDLSSKNEVDSKKFNTLESYFVKLSNSHSNIEKSRYLLNKFIEIKGNLNLIKSGLDVVKDSLKEVEEEIILYSDNSKCPLCGGSMDGSNHFDLDLLNQKIESLRQKKTKCESEISVRDTQIEKLNNEVRKLGYDPSSLDVDIKKIEESLLVFEKEAEVYIKELEELEGNV